MSSSPKSNVAKPDATDTEKEEEKVEALGGITRLLKEYGDGVACYGWLGAIGALGNGASMPAFFVLFGDMISMGSEPTMDLKTDALIMMLKFFGVGVAFFIFNSLQYVCWGHYGAKISVAVRKSYFQILLRQEVGYYDEKNSGALNTAFISDCLCISEMGQAIGLCLQHFVTFLGGFILAFYYSWQLSLVLMCAVPLFILVGVISSYFEKKGMTGGAEIESGDTKGKVDPTAAAGSFSNEVLQSIRSVKAIPMLLTSKLREYREKLEAVVPAAKKKSLGLGVALGGMFFAFLGVMYSLGYWYGGKLVDNGTIDIGDMFLCMFALPIGAMSLGQLGSANADVAKARNSANKLFALKDRIPKIRAADIDKKEPIKTESRLKGNIAFKNVSFSYPTALDTVVLDKVSFEIESGRTLAIVGPSGSGKSTIINLLERYYDPSDGEVLVDDEMIHNFDIEYLRGHIGYVSQTPLLFAESIKENIRGGNPNISDDDIIKAAKTADAHDFIMKLTDKYETNVGEMGNKLSGGEKQRVSIARAVVSNPSILLFDEATSALDTKSEREVQKAIDNISGSHSQTIVVIAHRLSTIKNADKILVIVDGEVAEEGNHESLIESNGVYAALVREQQVTDLNDEIVGNNEEIVEEKEAGKTEQGKTEIADAMDREVKVAFIGKSDDEKKEEKEKEDEKVPDMGGTKRLSVEYANALRCLFYNGIIFAVCTGALWPVAYGWFFPEIITIFTEEIKCDATALSVDDCDTNFEEASINLVYSWCAIGIYALVVQVMQTYLFGVYGTKLANMVKADWFESLLRQDVTYHDEETSAALNATLTAETQTIADGMGFKFGMLIQSITQALFGFFIAFYRSWRVTLVFLAITPLLVILGLLQSWIYMGTGGKNADPFLDAGVISQEILTNIRTVLAFPYLISTKTEAFVEKLHIGLPIATKRALISGLSLGLNLMIGQGVCYGVGMYAGLRFVDNGWVDFDDVIGAFFGVFMGGMGLGVIGSVIPAFQQANIAANKFYVAKSRKAEIKSCDDGLAPITGQNGEPLKGSIEFKNVSFAYQSNPEHMVLNNVSFKVNAGHSLAIVGPSGSGKSTLVSLIERFYDPNTGEILLDDNDATMNPIHNYDISYLRSSIGLVSQMPLLFDASITENIRAGNMEATEKDIINAATQANAHDFIEKLEHKYDTTVGELGGRLSGGQKQRIAIARALLGKPSILLLDEATSSLDSISEREVQDAIDSISENGNQTVISIAHRLSTIRNANTIIVLVDGQVRESGNHQELIANCGVYAALVNAQTLVEEKKEFHDRQRSLIVEEGQKEGDQVDIDNDTTN